ncbi:MAG: FHA domain-containing protein [Thermoanaerobaculia bacterium]
MIIECPSCRSRYQYGEERFDGKPSKKIRCAKCQQVFEVQNPTLATPEPPPQEFDADSTNVARFVRKSPAPAAAAAVPGHTDRAPLLTQMPPGRRISLAVLTGAAAATVHRIDKPQMTIGRAGADINIDDTEASRQHAMIEVRETSFRLIDLGSTNGTLVEGRKITEPVELTDKSEFQIGGTTLMLIVTDEQ